MRFHLVDRVLAWEPWRSVHARKLTSRSEELWVGPNDDPVMPPPLVLEALCQTGAWLVVLSSEGQRRAALASIGSVDFVAPVRPGDVIELYGSVDSTSEEMAVFSGRALVDGRAVLAAQDIMCILLDAERLEDADATARMSRLLTRAEGA